MGVAIEEDIFTVYRLYTSNTDEIINYESCNITTCKPNT